MRGFPLINVILVIAFFALAWWPLQRAVGKKAPEDETASSETASEEAFTLQITSSHPLASLSVAHLNAPLFSIDAPGDAMDELEDGREIENISVPPEGIEFWIEASFSGADDDSQRPVLSLELVPADVERELKPVTLWGDLGDSEIDEPAVFLWTKTVD